MISWEIFELEIWDRGGVRLLRLRVFDSLRLRIVLLVFFRGGKEAGRLSI